MKIIFAAFLMSASVHAATLCEVYGISDSPQYLSCTFAGNKVELTCHEGVYYVGTTAVESAYHYEVEEGPVPLVFKTASSELVVTLGERKSHSATLQTGRKKLRGKCRP